MNKEELLLEIIEKVHEQGQITARKVDELQIEQVRQGEIHRINSKNLEDHMARAENLEKRVAFYDSIVKVVAGLSATILFFAKVLPYLKHYL